MRAIPIAIALLLLIAAPVAAWDKEDWDPQASILVCGDPRVQATLDNTDSVVPTTFKMVWKNGNKSVIPARKVIKKDVAVGAVRVLSWRWVRGGGSKLKITAWNPDIGQWVPILIERIWAGPAWGTGDCVKYPITIAR